MTKIRDIHLVEACQRMDKATREANEHWLARITAQDREPRGHLLHWLNTYIQNGLNKGSHRPSTHIRPRKAY